MRDYEPAMSFDESNAAWYSTATRGDEGPCVEFLASHAGEGPVLELAVGTGRIALPLAERGLRIDGVDIAAPMLDKLREHPGAAGMRLAVGDMADIPFDGTYRLVFVVWNSFTNLLTQDEQVRCFESVAEHLADDGVFALENFVPRDIPVGGYVEPDAVELDGAQIGVWKHDAVTQVIEGQHIWFGTSGIKVNPIVQRYVWPAEMDLMARIAGLQLVERWEDWHRREFTGRSTSHVSVYARA